MLFHGRRQTTALANMTPQCLLIISVITLSFGTSSCRDRNWFEHRGKSVSATSVNAPPSSKHRLKLTVEFEPFLGEDGEPEFENGEPIVSYIPRDAFVDNQDRIEKRAIVLIRTDPPSPHRYVGRLLSLRPDVTIITSDRIVTDAKGLFRATLSTKTKIQDVEWEVKIHPPPGL